MESKTGRLCWGFSSARWQVDLIVKYITLHWDPKIDALCISVCLNLPNCLLAMMSLKHYSRKEQAVDMIWKLLLVLHISHLFTIVLVYTCYLALCDFNFLEKRETEIMSEREWEMKERDRKTKLWVSLKTEGSSGHNICVKHHYTSVQNPNSSWTPEHQLRSLPPLDLQCVYTRAHWRPTNSQLHRVLCSDSVWV